MDPHDQQRPELGLRYQLSGAASGAPPSLQAAPLFSKTAKRELNYLTQTSLH